MSKLIVVLGATGNQGGSVVRYFLENTDYRVRGVSRDISSAGSKALEAKGVEIVHGNVNDVESLKKAFKGANVIFAVTNFWELFFDPANKSKLRSGETINQWSYEAEFQQGRNISDAAATIVADSTLDLLVWSSMSAARKWSHDKYKHVYHFDSKAAVSEYIAERYPALDAKTSRLQLGFFATNWRVTPFLRPMKQIDGTYLLESPGCGNSPHPMVDVSKDTGLFVHALSQVSPGKELLGFGSLMSFNDYTKLWGSILGVEARFQEVPISKWEVAAPDGFGLELGEMFAYSAEFGYDGHDPSIIHPKDLGIDHLTTKIADYIKTEDWSSLITQ